MANHSDGTPGQAQTLIDLLQTISATVETGITLYLQSSASSASGNGQTSIRLSYRELLSNAETKASVLCHHIPQLVKGKVVLIYLDQHADSIPWLWAAVYAGLLPALLGPLPSNPQQRKHNIQHLNALLENPIILTTEILLKRFPELYQQGTHVIESLQAPTNPVPNGIPNGIPNSKHIGPFPQARGDEPCILMLTSGSTGNPKAVPLTVPQILSSVRGKGKALSTNDKWVLLNWIGLDHVANLTEIHLHALYHGAEQVQVQSSDIVSDPRLFLELIHKHRVSYSFAPNFFLALLSKKLAAADQSDPIFSIDLSCLKGIVSGGEANVVETAKALSKQFHALGGQGHIIFVGYGLTEACAALTYGPFDPEYEDREGHEFASVGKTIEGARIRVQTREGALAEPYQEGELQLSGANIVKSYYRDPENTSKSFTKDGWFMSGDRGYIDREGKLNLAGRYKETLIINGVNYSPVDIENTLEAANISSVLPSYFATFPHRAKGSDTEGYCVIYSPEKTFDIPEHRYHIVESVASIASTVPGVRPDWVIPLPASRLEKSSLGKLSRSKLKKEFDNGAFDNLKIRSKFSVQQCQPASIVAARTKTERIILDVLSDMLDIPTGSISVDRTIFELGITSITLFHFEQLLRTRYNLGAGVSIINFLNSPIIQHIANAIDNTNSTQYNPVALLQSRGDKHPLWLVHPASGNVLAFLPLARTMTDRPLYALSSRGLGANEPLFSSIPEMAETYYEHVKRTQPNGPYALMGYSLGTTVAFELAKRLEAHGDEVVFCGALDSPPHIVPMLANLDWTAAAVRVTYFLGLIAQDDIPVYQKQIERFSRDDVIKRLLELAHPEQLAKLQLTSEQLTAIVNVTDNFGECNIYSYFIRGKRSSQSHRKHGQKVRARRQCQTGRGVPLHSTAFRVPDQGGMVEWPAREMAGLLTRSCGVHRM